MNKPYLRKLASLLEDMPVARKQLLIPIQKLDMETWFDTHEFQECGTTACAGGLASLHPWFRNRGLKTSSESQFKNMSTARIHAFIPAYKNESGYDALGIFFGLSDSEVKYIFCPYTYTVRRGPKTVAKRIRDLIQNGMPAYGF